MKVTVQPDGTIELEVTNGDGQAALDLIRSLGVREVAEPADESDDESDDEDVIWLDPAQLTKPLREAYDALAEFPRGAHVSVIAERMGKSQSLVNSRLVALRKRGFAEWLRSGTYRLAGE